MTGSDYLAKPKFNENFWRAFRGVLGKNHEVQSLAKCDFGPISEHLAALREAKKAATKEEKEAAKKAREEEESKFKFAQVDDRREQVGNFRVEPPGLFRGRGEHPKMGMLKRRIYPRDITINIGPGEAVRAFFFFFLSFFDTPRPQLEEGKKAQFFFHKKQNFTKKTDPDAPVRGPAVEGDPPRQHRHVAGVLEGEFSEF